MSDKALLELAAKSIGLTLRYNSWGTRDARQPWNPLENDGDAFRLAVSIGAVIQPKGAGVEVWVFEERISSGVVDYENDRCVATRRAIVLAAAKLGKERPQ